MGGNENVISVLKPIFYFTKFFGLTPFSLAKPDKGILIVDIIWCSIMFIWNIYVYSEMFQLGSNSQLIIAIADFLNFFLMFITIQFSILCCYIYKNEISTVITDLVEIDNCIKKSNFHSCDFNHRTRKMLFIAAVMINLIIMLFLGHFLFMDVSIIDFCLHTSTLYTTFLEMQFCAITLLIKDRFAILNSEIYFLTQCHTSIYWKSCLLSKTTLFNKTQLQSLDSIENIAILHEKLSLLSKKVNKVYLFPILLIITQEFITIFNLTFALAIAFIYSSSPFMELPYLGLLILFCTTHIVVIIFICFYTSTEAIKTRDFIASIMESTSRIPSRELNLQVISFSLEILQNKVNFTASGLFTLNPRFVYDLFSAIVTYTIILIQFEIAYIGDDTVENVFEKEN